MARSAIQVHSAQPNGSPHSPRLVRWGLQWARLAWSGQMHPSPFAGPSAPMATGPTSNFGPGIRTHASGVQQLVAPMATSAKVVRSVRFLGKPGCSPRLRVRPGPLGLAQWAWPMVSLSRRRVRPESRDRGCCTRNMQDAHLIAYDAGSTCSGTSPHFVMWYDVDVM